MHSTPVRCGLLILACTLLSASAALAVDEVPKGYTLVKSTAAGKAMTIERDKPGSVHDIIESTLDDLDDYFDADYEVFGLYEDQRDHRSGISPITAKYGGKAVKGFVAAKVREKGAVVIVVFWKADATAAQSAELMRVSQPAAKDAPKTEGAIKQVDNPTTKGAAREPAAPETPVELKEYRFPDGTGAVGLAPGWKTTAQSCQNGFEVTGPAGQQIFFGTAYSVSTPDSTTVALARQYPVPGQVLLISPFVEPTQAVINLVPQLSVISQRSGGSALEVDHVTKLKDLPPQSPGSQWALVSYGLTRTTREGKRHYQAVLQAGSIPIAAGAWMLWSTQMSAPDESAAADIPVMFAIVGSWRTNDRQIQQNTDAWIASRNTWFAGQQAAHKAQTDAFDAQNANWRKSQAEQDTRNRDWESRQNAAARSVDDFDETIRGYRDIENTTTGQRTSVDLGNVNEIVNKLNEADPGRYIQVPLRDQADPIPRR